jgi:hypothetical protein
MKTKTSRKTIKLKSLLESHGKSMPSPELGTWILENQTVTISDWLYHGTPMVGLRDMLVNGIYGTEHGEVAEHDTLSTSINSEMLSMFSERDGTTGLQFKVQNAKIVVLDDILTYLVTQLPGSGISAEIDDEENFEKFCEEFNIPADNWMRTPYLPYNYLSSLGVDGFMYDYVYNSLNRGTTMGHRDESEIAFAGNGLKKLNDSVDSIWIDGNEYDISDKAEALKELESRL